MSERVPVTFSPAGVTVWVERGTTVLEAARRAGLLLPAPCGGRGACGSCGFRILSGEPSDPDEFERKGLSVAPPGVRLACRARVDTPLEVQPIVARRATTSVAGSDPVTDETLVAAIDLGTTTVSAVIVGADSGRELGRATTVNAQQSWGSDVLSRLSAADDGAGGELRVAAEGSMVDALRAACDQAGTCLARVARVVIAGNTAMMALLAQLDVAPLATAPFSIPEGIGAVQDEGPLRSALPHDCEFVPVPGIASFVGGDVSAGLLAAGLIDRDGAAIYIDIGTNAEIVIATSVGLTVTSAAAGPAFEGFGIAYGGVWGDGAIERVTIEGSNLTIEVAGDVAPDRICGSGLVSLVAEMRRAGHLSSDGRMNPAGPLGERFSEVEGVMALGLGSSGGPPYLLQTDVRVFQTAKAAVAAGIVEAAGVAHLKPRGVERLCVAGTFGGTLAARNLVDLGVLPGDVADDVEVVADAALLGAAMLGFEPSLREQVLAALGGAVHVELASRPTFSESFVRHTALEPYRLGRELSR